MEVLHPDKQWQIHSRGCMQHTMKKSSQQGAKGKSTSGQVISHYEYNIFESAISHNEQRNIDHLVAFQNTAVPVYWSLGGGCRGPGTKLHFSGSRLQNLGISLQCIL